MSQGENIQRRNWQSTALYGNTSTASVPVPSVQDMANVCGGKRVMYWIMQQRVAEAGRNVKQQTIFNTKKYGNESDQKNRHLQH